MLGKKVSSLDNCLFWSAQSLISMPAPRYMLSIKLDLVPPGCCFLGMRLLSDRQDPAGRH
eukprot:scaffold70997_cov16-Tisochrysis_lutea.AAC.2